MNSENNGMFPRCWLVAAGLFTAVPSFFYFLGQGVGRGNFTGNDYGVFSLPMLGLLAAMIAFVPVRREVWLRFPRLLAFAVVIWVLVVGQLIETIVFSSAPSGGEVLFHLLYTLGAGVLASLFARRIAKAVGAAEGRVLRMARVGCDGMWSFDLRSLVARWDEAFGIKFGYRREEVGNDLDWWKNRVHPEDLDATLASVQEAAGNPGCDGWSGIYRFRRADGFYAWIMARCAFERSEGKAVKIFGGLVDISDRIHIEEELRKRVEERSREIAALAYSVTHDLKSPLSSILGYGELLLSSGAIDEGSRNFLIKMVNGASRMDAIIEDMLQQTRDEVNPVGFGVVRIADIFDDLQAEYSLAVDRAGGRLATPTLDFPELYTSRSLIYRILQNLVGNALKYARPGVAPDVTVEARLIGARLALRVVDNGIGITVADTANIFEFGRRSTVSPGVRGYGVGLHSVRQSAIRLGGNVRVDSRPGAGSEFTVEIPVRILGSGQ